MQAKLDAVRGKLEKFRQVQRSLQGSNDVNEIRVILNRLTARLGDKGTKISPVISDLNE